MGKLQSQPVTVNSTIIYNNANKCLLCFTSLLELLRELLFLGTSVVLWPFYLSKWLSFFVCKNGESSEMKKNENRVSYKQKELQKIRSSQTKF